MPPVPQLPAPSAQGTLAKTPLLHLLVYAHERRLSGTIELDEGDRKAVLVMVAGLVAKVRSADAVAYLGELLKELGADAAAVDAALSVSREKGRPLGEALRAARAVSEELLARALSLQIERKVAALYTLSADTRFRYFDAIDVLTELAGDDHAAVDPLALALRGARTAPSEPHMSAALGRISATRLALAEGATPERFAFDEDERAVLAALSSPKTFTELAADESIDPVRLQRTLYFLLIAKQLEATEVPSAAAPLAKVSLHQKVAPKTQISEERALSGRPDPRSATPCPPAPPEASPHPELLERLRARAVSIKGEDFFTVLGLGRDADTARVQAAFLTLAKQWHPDAVPSDLEDGKAAAASIFSRISEAHATLGDPERRATYLATIEAGDSEGEQAQVIAVLEAATAFQKAEFYLKRSDYAQAEALARQALEGDSTQPHYLALVAWLEALKPEGHTHSGSVDAIAKLSRAVKMNDKCERAFFYRGQIYKRLGDRHHALADFKRALELDPRNVDAAREIRLFEMRGGKATPSIPPPPKAADKPGGFFGRLFKK